MPTILDHQLEDISKGIGQFPDSPLINRVKQEMSFSEREALKQEAGKIIEANSLWLVASYGSAMSSLVSLGLGSLSLSAAFGAATIGSIGLLVHSGFKSKELHERICKQLHITLDLP